MTKPLRELTKYGVHFKWGEKCQESFLKIKEAHGPERVVATLAQEDPTLRGEGEHCFRPVNYTRRPLTETEKRYSKVEGESLGIMFGILSNRTYLYGTELEVVVDHRPLVTLYNSLNRPAPVRVDRHRSKLLAFRFKVIYEPRHQNPSDYTSRNPHKAKGEAMDGELGKEGKEEDAEFAVNRILDDNLPGLPWIS